MAVSHTTNRVLWIVTSVLAIVAAAVGVLRPAIYDGVVAENIVPGVFTQDLVVFAGAMALLVLALMDTPARVRSRIVIAGILGFFFYAYGVYAMEQVYTELYFVYLAILGLSLFTIASTLVSLDYERLADYRLPPFVRVACSAYAIFVAIMFTFIWTGALIPLIRDGFRKEFTFSIYIIDLSFVMPAMAVSGVMALRRKPLGIVGVPALFVLGAGILSPLALAELLKPALYGRPTIPGELWLYLVLSVVFVGLTVLYLATLRAPKAGRAPG
jgi:hypothetical protein